jgi:hypothetical protein
MTGLLAVTGFAGGVAADLVPAFASALVSVLGGSLGVGLVADLALDLASGFVAVVLSVAAATGTTSVRAATIAHQLAVRFPPITDQHPPTIRSVKPIALIQLTKP